jgi:flagellar biosynthesis/type III secretory pathway M-ring protein FliF/YscJ
MGAIRQVFSTIGKYLGELTGRDRLLIGALAAVAALALVLVALTTSRTTMVELLPGMGPEDQARAQGALSEADIAFEMRSGRVFVAPDKRMYAVALLQQSGKMPANAETLYSNLVKSQNWMASKSQSDQLFNAALCEFLGGVISNFKGVERASVVIDAPEPVGMGLAFRKPTASVGVTMKAGRQVDKELVDAIAAMVAGSRSGLAMTDVKVVDLRNGRQFTARGEDDFAAGDYLELVAKIEQRVQAKVRELIAYDPGAIVAVSAQVDNTRRRTSTEKFLNPSSGTVSVPSKTSETEKKQSSGGSSPGAEPGVASNVAADVNQGGGSGNQTSNQDSDSTSEFKVAIGSTREEVVDPRGTPTRVNVMISLSREYISHLVKMSRPAPGGGAAGAGDATAAGAAAEPTQAELDLAFAGEKKRLETDLTPLIRTVAMESTASGEPRVVVSMIPVPQGMVLAAGGALAQGALLTGGGGGGGGGAMGGLTSQLLSGGAVKTGFLGLLAVVALGMMVMLVRKSSKPQELPTAQEIVGLPPVLETEDSVVGEADESQTAMVGIELGDEEVKVKKMLEQVQQMVKENPADAANLLKRWMNPDR